MKTNCDLFTWFSALSASHVIFSELWLAYYITLFNWLCEYFDFNQTLIGKTMLRPLLRGIVENGFVLNRMEIGESACKVCRDQFSSFTLVIWSLFFGFWFWKYKIKIRCCWLTFVSFAFKLLTVFIFNLKGFLVNSLYKLYQPFGALSLI